MWKAIAWGVGLAVVNVAAATWMSKSVNAKAKEADEEYKKYMKQLNEENK